MTTRFWFDADAALDRARAIRRGEVSPPTLVSGALAQESRVAQLPEVLAEAADSLGLSPDEEDQFEERAAILEYDAGLPRAEAERCALAELLSRSS